MPERSLHAGVVDHAELVAVEVEVHQKSTARRMSEVLTTTVARRGSPTPSIGRC
jgi:hypothetical protein